MRPQPTFRDQLKTRGPWFGAFLFIFIGASVAGWNYRPSSSTRRGGAMESAFKGLEYIAGTAPTKDVGLMWTGRVLVLLGLAAAGYGVWRLLQKGSTGPTQPTMAAAQRATPPPPSHIPQSHVPQSHAKSHVPQSHAQSQPPHLQGQAFPNPFNGRREQ